MTNIANDILNVMHFTIILHSDCILIGMHLKQLHFLKNNVFIVTLRGTEDFKLEKK